MKFFLDTEFIEDGKTIDLISIGIVTEDGDTYYGLNLDCDLSKANLWVRENVIAQLPDKKLLPQNKEGNFALWDDSLFWTSHEQIALEVTKFIKKRCVDLSALSNGEYGTIVNNLEQLRKLELDVKPEFWAYYADYDWVVFCQLFGTMIDLPVGFPMYCNDIKQECQRLGNPELPKQRKGSHNALEDAKWNKRAYEFLQKYQQSLGSFSLGK